MSRVSRVSFARRLWPQRLRTRLAIFYSLLFLAAGLGLVALAYTLANPLLAPVHQPDLRGLTSSKLTLLQHCKPLPSNVRGARECIHLLALISGTQNGTGLAVVKIGALIGVVVVVVGAIALGWLAAGRALAPVRSITAAALSASELRLGHRLALSGPEDELKALGDTFDLMLERLDAAFTSQQRFVANAAHELRTPLTAMRTAIDVTLAKPERTAAQLEEMAERVRRSVERAEATIEALLTLATSELGTTTAEGLDLATAAEDALDAARGTIDQRELQVVASLEPAPTHGDRVLLERMVANLVENAVRHNHPGGSIWIRTRRQDGSSLLELANTGPLVTAAEIPALFQPFTRAEQRVGFDQGVGLGLSIADAIARAHDAEICARERDGGGLELTLTVPGDAMVDRTTPRSTI
jgi:signal transduction histidine kinase